MNKGVNQMTFNNMWEFFNYIVVKTVKTQLNSKGKPVKCLLIARKNSKGKPVKCLLIARKGDIRSATLTKL